MAGYVVVIAVSMPVLDLGLDVAFGYTPGLSAAFGVGSTAGWPTGLLVAGVH